MRAACTAPNAAEPRPQSKSVLLHALLGELPHLTGDVRRPDVAVAYCAQDPWLQGGLSVRDNIVFTDADHDAVWYAAVIRACALDIDFAQTAEGDAQLASGLSGGQRARIALARAVYSRAPVVFCDDTLAALDAITEAHVFEHVFGPRGLLRDRSASLPRVGGLRLICLLQPSS